MHFCAVLGCLIMFEFTHCFITPTESEPECLGVQCQTFDPNTCKCEESAFPESPSNWPLGNYGLPASLYGCPEITWQTKYINMTVPSDIKDIYWEPGGFTFDHYSAPYKVPYNNKLLILGPFSERTVQLNFCVREDGDFNDLSIMHGKFCIYKIGTHCHDGYNEGSITIKGYRTDIRGFRTNVPTVDGGVLVSFCCRNDVISTLSNVLPQTYPFVLLKGPTAGSCEPLTNMIVTEDILYLTHDGVHFDYKGTLPNMTITDSHVGISFCVYQPEHYKDAVYSDYMYVAKTFPVYSVGKPYYSSPYVEPPANVTIGPEVVAGNGFTVVETYKPWLQIDLQQFVRIEYVFKIYKKIFFVGPEVVAGNGFTVVETYKPWLQIDLQQFVRIEYVFKIYKKIFFGRPMNIPNIYGVYVSRDQWDFVHQGAVACFFGIADEVYECRRPVIGQYVTFVLEYEIHGVKKVELIEELQVHGQAIECGKQLGMISGDIKEFQIETSSNYKDIQYSKALQGTKGWCTSEKDTERWLMIDLIVPTTVHGIALHGWYQVQSMFIDSFVVEYGVRKNNMTVYSDSENSTKVFEIDTLQDVNSLHKFWFLPDIIARYVKIKINEPTEKTACLKIELIGCPVYGSRNIFCNDNTSNKKPLDFGFASIHDVAFDKTFVPNLPCDTSESMTFDVCLQLTGDSGYIGNVYNNDRKECCFYNISSTNRHFKNSWPKVNNPGYIVSERLCFNEFYSINDSLKESHTISLLSIPGTIHHLYSPFFPSNYPKGIETETILYSEVYIKLTITYLSFAETVTRDQLLLFDHPEIQPGSCKDSIIIDFETGNKVKLTRDNQDRYRHATFMSSYHRIFIKFVSCFQYLTSLEENVFELKAEVIDKPGCGIDGTREVYCTAKTAWLASFLYPALYTLSDTNFWMIIGTYGQYIELKFVEVDVFYPLNPPKSFVEVFDFDLEEQRSSMGRFSKASMPRGNLVSSWHMMALEFRVSSDSTGKGFLGLYTIIDATVHNIVSESSCNHTWYYFNKSCYSLFSSKKMTQNTAEKECLSRGGHLVVINSEDEMAFVHQLIIYTTSPATLIINQIYIGLTKRNKGNKFTDYVWVNGEPLIYTAWYKNEAKGTSQPDGFYDEQCVAIILDSIHNRYNWHDVPCAYENIHFIMCETEVHSPDLERTLMLRSAAIPSPMSFKMLRCGNGEYISQLFICDRYSDCSDKSDEMVCDTKKCDSSQYKCASGQCIHLTFYCDGIFHCNDGSDESYCEWPACKTDEWKCENRLCIPTEKRCDVKLDCTDGSDEKDCISCSPTSFQCYDRSCISFNRICDGIPDCPGRFNEDEMNCQTRQIQDSCEDWWLIGARTNGMHFINQGSADDDYEQVHCQFNENAEMIVISTSFYYKDMYSSTIYKFHNGMIQTVSRMPGYTCSQDVLIVCYFHEVFSDKPDVIFEACNGSCKCIGTTDWTKADPNDVLIDNITITNSRRLPFLGFYGSTVSYSDEGFYDVQMGPVTCTSEISKNISIANIHLCRSGKLYDYRDNCLLHFNEYNDVSGCRDLSHLHQCENVTCPDSFFKCPEGHCLSPNLVCDANKQCKNGEDELNCVSLTCPGLFRCRKSNTCLSHQQVCDGKMQCPSGDDEIGCGIICPRTCTCEGFVFTCRASDVEKLNVSAKARKLDLSNSIFPAGRATVNDYPFLVELIMLNCSIVSIDPYTFRDLKNLIVLDLSFNRVEKLREYTFYSLHRLEKLILIGNRLLTTIEPNTFLTLRNVQNLELIGFNIDKLQSGTFNGLENLKHLNVSGNGIRAVAENAFSGLRLRNFS